MPKMTGGEALVKSLYVEGVRVLFGLPGVQIYHALDALVDEPRIQFITTRHEQATTYMADGYARTSGKIGASLVVPGPGLLNASAGIATAYAASSPILIVSGQIQRDLIGIRRGVLHEIDDQLDTIAPVTKWRCRILDPKGIPAAINEAFYYLRTGRPRPVEIEIPPDTLSEIADVEILDPAIIPIQAPDSNRIQEAVKMITSAKNPIFWAGGGAISSNASKILLELAVHLQAQVVTTPEGKGMIPEDHYLSAGVMAGRGDQLLADNDLIISIGSRMANFNTAASSSTGLTDIEISSDKRPQVIQIDIDPEEIGRNYTKTFGLVGDARTTLESIFKIIACTTPASPNRADEFIASKDKTKSNGILEPQNSFTSAIRSAIPRDAIVVSGMTQIGYYSRRHLPMYDPRTYITSSYLGNLGYAYPTALGAKVANPNKTVVALSGDGGFLFNSQELATAVQYGINVIAIVFNDNAYGNVLRDQTKQFNGRVMGSRLHNPDFLKLAESYGVKGIKAEGPEELRDALEMQIANPSPTLIEVPVEMMPSPFN